MTDSLAIRRSSRLVIVSPGGRLLLFRYSDEHSDPFWATVGGELVGNETYRDAAIRELHEETGYRTEIGPMIRERNAVFAVARSQPAQWMERYFLVCVDAENIPSRENWTDEERSTIVNYRWWSHEELVDPLLTVKPDWIPELLEAVLSGFD